MIDLHNHILPDVDDGPRELADSLTMARQAVENGTTVMAATPHRYAYGREIIRPDIELRVRKLQDSLDKEQIPLRIIPGVEIPMHPDTLEQIKTGRLIALGGEAGHAVLIEPPFESVPAHALPLLEAVQELGLTPILAHPERNGEIQHGIGFVEECAALGIVIQLTAGSIVGKFGVRAQATAREIALHTDWRIIIASDAHDPKIRTPSDMRPAMGAVAEWIGDEAAAKRMVEELPHSLIPSG